MSFNISNYFSCFLLITPPTDLVLNKSRASILFGTLRLDFSLVTLLKIASMVIEDFTSIFSYFRGS